MSMKNKKIDFDVDEMAYSWVMYIRTCFNFQTVVFGERSLGIVDLL